MALLHPVVAGFVWGVTSALSLPLGAALGLQFQPGEVQRGIMMAFGAGALLFASIVDLYGKALHDIDHHGKGGADKTLRHC